MIFLLDLSFSAIVNTSVTDQDADGIAMISSTLYCGNYKVQVEINSSIVIKGEIADNVRSLNVVRI